MLFSSNILCYIVRIPMISIVCLFPKVMIYDICCSIGLLISCDRCIINIHRGRGEMVEGNPSHALLSTCVFVLSD